MKFCQNLSENESHNKDSLHQAILRLIQVLSEVNDSSSNMLIPSFIESLAEGSKFLAKNQIKKTCDILGEIHQKAVEIERDLFQ
jgi:hypothetical protein